MSNPSNLYAEKIFSEHPLSLWALDDKLDYISLVDETDRNLTSGWTLTNASASSGSAVDNKPFPSSACSLIQGTVPGSQFQEITCISPNIMNFQDMNPGLQTFSIGTYFYVDTPYMLSISLGYEYTDPTTSLIVQELKQYTISFYQRWSHISQTFTIPNVNANLRIIFKINSIEGGVFGEYNMYLNGITLGQWSEEFNSVSLGIASEEVPNTISIPATDGVEAVTYGISSNSGYYLVDDNALLARNTSIPLVYGASGLTKLFPGNSKPSLIIPGKGFLNKSGQYNDYTVEFWARLSSDTLTSKRIFGPINSTDGLYVKNDSITLVIGDSFESYFVGEWYRPMIIHIRLIRNSASVLINGEEVISLNIDTSTLDLPDELDENGKNQNWLGFYCHDDTFPIEIDCFAIYTYQIPTTVAKRRWVYGQGVLSPEGINSAYGGTAAFIDYPFSKYAVNYTYPNFAQWQQGSFDNLLATSASLSVPEYTLPEIFLETKTLNELYLDNQNVQEVASGLTIPNKFITFRPNAGWNSEHCYFNFNRLNVTNDQVKTIYGVFSTSDIGPESGPEIQPQTLLKIYNDLTGNYFIIRQEENIIKYVLFFDGEEDELYTTDELEANQLFSVGIQIDTISSRFGQKVSSFFGNQNGLKVYIGGDEDPLNTFTGNIYSVGFSTSLNSVSISDYFNSNGIAIFDDMSVSGVFEEENAIALIDHTASYTLLPNEDYSKYFLDIGVSGYWEDYLPLSYFGKYVKNASGKDYYDLDFLQFNIGYPSPSQLLNENSYPYYQTDTGIYSYITLQYILDGANLFESNFTTTQQINKEKIIDIGEYENWETTKFEVLDNTLIYFPKSVNFNDLAIVYHVNFNSRSTLNKTISLNRLEIASQALSNNSFNPIGTRFGIDVFPYKRSGFYYDYKSKNPFSIYKGSTPYLYLTRNSGIEVRDKFDVLVDRGISLPINSELATDYRVSAMQFWIRYDQDAFSNTPVKLLEVDYRDSKIKIFIVSNSADGKRGKIYAVAGEDNVAYNGIAFYVNGNIVNDPVINIKEWTSIGVSFLTSIEFSSYLGSIRLSGPFVYNNIAFYQANSIKEIQSSINRPWFKVLTIDGSTYYDWSYWLNNYTWDGMLILSSSEFYGINPLDIYKSYIGTNKIIFDDEEGFLLNKDKIRVYSEVSWYGDVGFPV